MTDAYADPDYPARRRVAAVCGSCGNEWRMQHYCGMRKVYAASWIQDGDWVEPIEYDDPETASVGMADIPGTVIVTRYVSDWVEYTP